MNKLTKKGFVETENDFSQYSASELVRHFHQYGFKDAEVLDVNYLGRYASTTLTALTLLLS